MMRGYWYIPALAGICSVFTKLTSSAIFVLSFLIWLIMLYATKRIGEIALIISLTSYLFFLFYIPQPFDKTLSQSSQNTELFGKISSPIDVSEKLLQFNLQTEKYGLIKMNMFQPNQEHEQFHAIQYGARCKVFGELRIPQGSSNPGQFDYNKYLAGNGIFYEMIIPSIDDITCQDSESLSSLYNLRAKFINWISDQFSEETSAWILALVVGDDQIIPDQTIALFQRWGLSHILAISGLHIALVVGILYFLTIKLNLVTKENAQYLVVFILPVYAILAGGEPSVWRASIMILLVIIIQKLQRRISTADVISLTFLGLILVQPYYIYHIGFQLSFIVTFGIILSGDWLMRDNSLWFSVLKISTISQLIIIPLQVIYFFNINPLSIILNVFVVPYFTFFVIPFLFFLLVISPFQPVARFLDVLFMYVHEEAFLRLISWIDQHLYFPWITGYFPVVYIVIYYVLLLAMMRNLHIDKLIKAFTYGLMLTGLLIGLVIRPYLSPYGTVTMLDIGQGDAMVIELPYRRGIFLVDAGSGFSFEDMKPSDTTYQRIIKPFLHSRGITEIDAMVISHEDMDHAGSVPFLVKDFNVKALMVSQYYEFNEEWIGELAGIAIYRVASGDKLEINEKMFTILSPGVDRNGSNENSLVFQMKLGDKEWLFTGDIDMEAEQAILEDYPDLRVDVLKVAHHGSNTSSNPLFITSTKPHYALISVGKNNRYGHPSSDVLDILKTEGVRIMRTDENGAILYRFTEDKGTFYYN